MSILGPSVICVKMAFFVACKDFGYNMCLFGMSNVRFSNMFRCICSLRIMTRPERKNLYKTGVNRNMRSYLMYFDLL